MAARYHGIRTTKERAMAGHLPRRRRLLEVVAMARLVVQ